MCILFLSALCWLFIHPLVSLDDCWLNVVRQCVFLLSDFYTPQCCILWCLHSDTLLLWAQKFELRFCITSLVSSRRSTSSWRSPCLSNSRNHLSSLKKRYRLSSSFHVWCKVELLVCKHLGHNAITLWSFMFGVSLFKTIHFHYCLLFETAKFGFGSKLNIWMYVYPIKQNVSLFRPGLVRGLSACIKIWMKNVPKMIYSFV